MATFTAYPLMNYTQFVFYTVLVRRQQQQQRHSSDAVNCGSEFDALLSVCIVCCV